RLCQRLISAVTAPTAEGRLYEVDMRLRPSGASGPIATSLTHFAQYQREEAWTWEHMALTRARPVAGDARLRRRIEAAVAAALGKARDPMQLVADVADMRRRIADEHPRPAAFDLRNRPGGLVDLEFIVQYLMLREAAHAPEVLRRDIGGAIEALGEAGILASTDAQALGDACALLRAVRAFLTLLFDGTPEADALAGATGTTLARSVGAVDFARLGADITAACAAVRECYDRLIADPAQRALQSAATPNKPQKGGVAK
ncbi:MAG TPA: glutamine-synthetase adenylyltransferase, partial [Stellaceae bacterium]|nr:glutamine-synthetase adenylyltransferase [Stellaceae bacterium]